MSNFSRIGIAFKKRHLLELGASPVFYIAREAPTDPGEDEGHRAQAFDQWFERFHDMFHRYREQLAEHRLTTMRLESFLSKYVFAFRSFSTRVRMKPIPETTTWNGEWRVLGNVIFELTDVWRIIVPPEYGGRLREALPSYIGQVSFAPEIG